jgi:glycosyltransferase involved in cell wall biosynthesis
MDSEPLVSIILPTYNRERYLREAVDSVLAQSYQRWELVVIDDGSTDGTREYLAELRDARVRAVYSHHVGHPAQLRNRGAVEATGMYVAFLDSDDVWHPRKLQLQVQDLQDHQECQWGYAYCERIGPAGERLPLPPGRGGLPYRGWITDKLVTVEAVVTMPTVIMTREFFHEVGGFDESFRYFSDYEFWTRCSLASPVTVVTMPLAQVRDHPGSYTTGKLEVWEDWTRMTDEVRARTRDPNLQGICLTQKRSIQLRQAARYRQARMYWASFRTLLRSMGHRQRPVAWAAQCIKTALYPLTPAPLLRLYQRHADRQTRA